MELEPLMKKYKTRLLEIYGIVKRDFVVLLDSLFKKTSELNPYLQMSYYAKTLKAKPTAKSKKG